MHAIRRHRGRCTPNRRKCTNMRHISAGPRPREPGGVVYTGRIRIRATASCLDHSLCSRICNKKHDAAFSFVTCSITLDSPAAFRAAACSARHTGARRAPQLRTIVADAELKNNGSAKESGRGPGPRTTSWKETSDEKAMMHRARTRDCEGRRDSRNEMSRIVVRMEVATMSGLVTSGIWSKPICIHGEHNEPNGRGNGTYIQRNGGPAQE